jgi:hypothetical protein
MIHRLHDVLLAPQVTLCDLAVRIPKKCGLQRRRAGHWQLAAEMEKAADAGDWHSVITRMDELELQFRLLSEAIEENERARRIK